VWNVVSLEYNRMWQTDGPTGGQNCCISIVCRHCCADAR